MYNLMKMAKSSPKGLKTLWEKEKLLVTSNFSFSRSVFKRLVLQTLKNQGLFGKGLMSRYSIWRFHFGRSKAKVTWTWRVVSEQLSSSTMFSTLILKDPITWTTFNVVCRCLQLGSEVSYPKGHFLWSSVVWTLGLQLASHTLYNWARPHRTLTLPFKHLQPIL